MPHPPPEVPPERPAGQTELDKEPPPPSTEAPPADKPSGGTPSTGTGGTGAIIGTDRRSVIVQPAELHLLEGETEYYTVRLGSRPAVPVAITAAVDGEVAIDPHELRFLPATWATAQTVAVTAVHDDDALADPPASLSHTAHGGDYEGMSVPAIHVTIAEDDAPTLWVAAATAQESSASVTFAVRLSLAGDHDVTVAYRTGAPGDTAGNGIDYQDRRGTLAFPAGSAAVEEIAVPVLDDKLDENDEHFTLTLANPVHAALAGGDDTLSVRAVIEDDDRPPALSIEGARAYEGAGVINFPVRLNRASGRTVTVQYATAPRTATQDQFTSASGTLRFPPGAITKSIPVTITDDPFDERTQAFAITLTAPVNATLTAGSNQAIGIIRDDDDPPVPLNYAGNRDRVFILNADWARLDDKVYALKLRNNSAEVHLIATNGSGRGQRPRVTVRGPSVGGAAYRDPPPRPALSELPTIPTIPTLPPDTAHRYAQPTGRSQPSWGVDGAPLTLAASSDRETFDGVPVTARSEVTDGSITATLWVGDDDWGTGCSGAGPCVTQEMADAVVERFLRAGDGNDIYDLVTAAFGAPWGRHSNAIRIPAAAAEHIHVVMYDIDRDGAANPSQCRAAGFFPPVHTQVVGGPNGVSAQRLMLVIDSALFATAEGDTWEMTDYQPRRTVSHLAHELAHLIHYYQKQIRRGGSPERWLDEMAAQVASDLIAERLMAAGPRGVAHDDPTAGTSGIERGRLPYYNLYNDISVTTWRGKIANYAVVYAFGAYLARTYGAELFEEMIQRKESGIAALEAALAALDHDVSFRQTLADWAVATLLSDNTDAPAPYRYNPGAWASSQIGGETYRLGSINLYNYLYKPSDPPRTCAGPGLADRPAQEGPYLHSLTTFHAKALPPHSNRYASLGSRTGTLQLLVNTPADTRLTLVIKK